MLKKGGDATHFSPSWELPTQQQKKPNLGARKLGSIFPFVATPECKIAIAENFNAPRTSAAFAIDFSLSLKARNVTDALAKICCKEYKTPWPGILKKTPREKRTAFLSFPICLQVFFLRIPGNGVLQSLQQILANASVTFRASQKGGNQFQIMEMQPSNILRKNFARSNPPSQKQPWSKTGSISSLLLAKDLLEG